MQNTQSFLNNILGNKCDNITVHNIQEENQINSLHNSLQCFANAKLEESDNLTIYLFYKFQCLHMSIGTCGFNKVPMAIGP